MNTAWLLNRLKEPSTWRGAIAIAMGLGIGISPEMIESIVSVGVSIIGAILVLKKDAKSPDS